MSEKLIIKFKQYRANVSLDRVRMCKVPDDLQPLVKAYREALSSQLSDPGNESWDSLGPNEHRNALHEVIGLFSQSKEKLAGNCPRCAGTGTILAYRHVLGGRCLQCDGTGSINV